VPAVVDTVKRLRWTLLVSIGSMGWASLYVIREWQKARGWETGMRPGWVVGDSNYFGISAVLVIPLAWYISQDKRPFLERVFCLGCMVLTLAATLLGGSRGGFLGLIAALVVVSLHSRKRVRNLTLASVVLVVFNVVYPYSPLHRFLHPNAGDKLSQTAHEAQYHAAAGMIRDHPLAGIGLGNFQATMLRYVPRDYSGPAHIAHNAYLSVATEMGIPAFLVFVALLVSTLVSMERLRLMRSAPALVLQAALGLQAGLCGAMVSIGFVHALDQKQVWLTIFLSQCVSLLARKVPDGGSGVHRAKKRLAAAALTRGVPRSSYFTRGRVSIPPGYSIATPCECADRN
jgi:O-antigen ligase